MPTRNERRRAAAQKRQSERRAAKSSRRQPRLDRADLLRLAAGLIEADRLISGVTLIEPTGEANHLDAELLRRGGPRMSAIAPVLPRPCPGGATTSIDILDRINAIIAPCTSCLVVADLRCSMTVSTTAYTPATDRS